MTIDEFVEEEADKLSRVKNFIVDSLPQSIGGTLLGLIPDYLIGLYGWPMAVSRGIAFTTNVPVGGIYGWCREKIFEYTGTNQESSFFRKWGAEMLSYEAVQVPLYTAGAALGLTLEGFILDTNFESETVMYAALIQFVASPVTSLVVGWATDKSREKFTGKDGKKPVAWKSYG
jgi:hypothetical protein